MSLRLYSQSRFPPLYHQKNECFQIVDAVGTDKATLVSSLLQSSDEENVFLQLFFDKPQRFVDLFLVKILHYFFIS